MKTKLTLTNRGWNLIGWIGGLGGIAGLIVLSGVLEGI